MDRSLIDVIGRLLWEIAHTAADLGNRRVRFVGKHPEFAQRVMCLPVSALALSPSHEKNGNRALQGCNKAVGDGV